MELVQRVTVLVENIGVSEMKERMTTLPVMINVFIRAVSRTIITGCVERNASTGKTVGNRTLFYLKVIREGFKVNFYTFLKSVPFFEPFPYSP